MNLCVPHFALCCAASNAVASPGEVLQFWGDKCAGIQCITVAQKEPSRRYGQGSAHPDVAPFMKNRASSHSRYLRMR